MKHERAIAVALSYVIGFTTAYIAYAIIIETTPVQQTLTVANTTQSQAASLADITTLAVTGSQGVVVETEEGIEVTRGDETRLIAVKRSFVPEFGAEAYDELIKANSSHDGLFTFYCVTNNSVECEAYIYSWEQNGIYPVKVDGERASFLANELNIAWSSDNRLQFNTAVSVSAETPWLLE